MNIFKTMSTHVECMMHRDGYGCKGKSEVLLVVEKDGEICLLCRECLKLNIEHYKDATLYIIGNRVTVVYK